MIAKPVKLISDYNDSYAVFRVYDANDNLLLNIQDCERYRLPFELERAKAEGEEIVAAINYYGYLTSN